MADAQIGGSGERPAEASASPADETISAGAPAEVGVRFEVDGEIATVTLCRPEKRNAQTPAMWSALARFGENLPEQVRIVVVRGEGPSFSAGLDLSLLTGAPGQRSFSEIAALDDAALERLIAESQRGFLWLRRPEIVSIAAVQGHAIGAGFQLALACDLRIAAEDAKFCMKEPALGLVPDLTGTKPLVELVGLPRAIEMCLTARAVDAAEAERYGLAERVVPAGDLDRAVHELVTSLLAIDRHAAAATKRLLLGARQRTLEEQAAAERSEQMIRLRTLFSAPAPRGSAGAGN